MLFFWARVTRLLLLALDSDAFDSDVLQARELRPARARGVAAAERPDDCLLGVRDPLQLLEADDVRRQRRPRNTRSSNTSSGTGVARF